MSELSDPELACLSGNIGLDRRMPALETPDLVTAEDGAALIECLEHETLLRLFLREPLITVEAAAIAYPGIARESQLPYRSWSHRTFCACMVIPAQGRNPEAFAYSNVPYSRSFLDSRESRQEPCVYISLDSGMLTG